ncbi:MAG: exosortase/archaeosortase family protein [Candidatus Omnitrophica bacterium]|nr:exosortase/archaeosortase family protein [Candidatus Omnitrophota bacterium]
MNERNKFRLLDVLIGIALVTMFSATFYRLMIYGWKSADYTHAYFILPISLFLIWSKRKALVKAQGANLSGSLIFILGILAYLFSVLNEFMFLEAASFVLMMWGIFRLRLTKESFKHLLFPLAYLIFLIPPPGLVIDSLTFPLKKIASVGSHWVLSLFHMPVELYGVILKVGGHELFIADACSGFRSIVTLLALGAVYVYFQDTSNMKKWVIFISVVPIAIFANIFRICLTGLIAYKWGAQKAEGFFHEFSGMVLFLIAVLCLMGLTGVVCRERKT